MKKSKLIGACAKCIHKHIRCPLAQVVYPLYSRTLAVKATRITRPSLQSQASASARVLQRIAPRPTVSSVIEAHIVQEPHLSGRALPAPGFQPIAPAPPALSTPRAHSPQELLSYLMALPDTLDGSFLQGAFANFAGPIYYP